MHSARGVCALQSSSLGLESCLRIVQEISYSSVASRSLVDLQKGSTNEVLSGINNCLCCFLPIVLLCRTLPRSNPCFSSTVGIPPRLPTASHLALYRPAYGVYLENYKTELATVIVNYLIVTGLVGSSHRNANLSAGLRFSLLTSLFIEQLVQLPVAWLTKVEQKLCRFCDHWFLCHDILFFSFVSCANHLFILFCANHLRASACSQRGDL